MMRVKIKQNDESRNSTTTLTDDGELVVALDASTTYFVDICITFDAGATPDFKYAYHYTGTITSALTFESTVAVVGTAAGGTGDGLAPAYNFGGGNFTTPSSRSLSGAASGLGGGHIRGVIITGTAGNLKVQWSQNTSDGANVTLHKGSYIAIAEQADMDGTLIVKPATTNRTNNTLAADPDLQFVTEAGKKYIYELFALGASASATPDFKCALHDAQVSQALGHVLGMSFQASGAFGATTEISNHGQFQSTTFLTTPTTGTLAVSGADRSHAHVHGSHVMGASDSTLAFEWAQNVTNATATVVATPSWMLYQEVP